MQKTAIIVIDALRYDVAVDFAPRTLHLYKCRSLADTTEPSLTTILSGLKPEEHGIVRTGQRNARRMLRRIRDRLLPRFFRSSFIASPAILFHPYFTYGTVAKYSEEIFTEAVKYLGKVDFMLLHCMDCHDMRSTPGLALKYYKGYEPIPEHVLEWRPPSGLPRPYEDDLRYARDAGWLKAKYRASVHHVFENIDLFLPSLRGWRIILTADHGESMVYWHHDSVPDPSVYEVPLMTNLRLEDRVYDHIDIYRMVVGFAEKQFLMP